MPGLGRRTFAPGEVLTATNVMGYLQDQAVMNFAGTAARGSAIGTAVSEGMVSYLADSNAIEVYDGSAWVNVASAGTASYRYVSTVYFTSSGTFSKASYPWLRAIRVLVQGAGGGSGGVNATSGSTFVASGGGGGGGYAESFITDIASLPSSVTVTVGAGGTGGTAGNNNGNAGGNSTFNSTQVVGNGGAGGNGGGAQTFWITAGGGGGGGGTGDLVINGGAGGVGNPVNTNGGYGGLGGDTTLSNQPVMISAWQSSSAGANGSLYGGGATGAASGISQTAKAGGNGANGIIIVELYA